jgi:hypothetical protein
LAQKVDRMEEIGDGAVELYSTRLNRNPSFKMFADYTVTLARTQALVVEHRRATADTVASRTPLQEIRDAIHMFEKGSCYMPERMWFAARVAELGSLHPECAPWATLFAATLQWNEAQVVARDAWRARWVDRVRGGWGCRSGMEPDGYEEAVAEAMAERQTMINERLAHNCVNAAEVDAMTPVQRVDLNNIPYWLQTIPDWLRRGYCDADGRAAGRAYT